MTNPEVRKVKVRLDGDDADAVQVHEMLGNLLPTMSQGLYQVGDLSEPYENRRGPGARRYFDLYILRTPKDANASATGQELAVRDSTPRKAQA